MKDRLRTQGFHVVGLMPAGRSELQAFEVLHLGDRLLGPDIGLDAPVELEDLHVLELVLEDAIVDGVADVDGEVLAVHPGRQREHVGQREAARGESGREIAHVGEPLGHDVVVFRGLAERPAGVHAVIEVAAALFLHVFKHRRPDGLGLTAQRRVPRAEFELGGLGLGQSAVVKPQSQGGTADDDSLDKISAGQLSTFFAHGSSPFGVWVEAMGNAAFISTRPCS